MWLEETGGNARWEEPDSLPSKAKQRQEGRLRTPLDAGARGAVYHLPDQTQHSTLTHWALFTCPTGSHLPPARQPGQNRLQITQTRVKVGVNSSLTAAGKQIQTGVHECGHTHSLYRRVHKCGHTHYRRVCTCGHAHPTDVCARVWARPLYRCVCVDTPTLQICVHECGHAYLLYTPTLQTCVHECGHAQFTDVCACVDTPTCPQLRPPPGSDRGGAALGLGPTLPLPQEPVPLDALPALGGRGTDGPVLTAGTATITAGGQRSTAGACEATRTDRQGRGALPPRT